MDAHRWPLHAGQSLYWAGLNQGKMSALIDTRTNDGRELVASLIERAGVLITNLPVREWNSYETLAERRKDLIMVVLTGNPDGSPAVDYTVNAAIGFPFVTGPADAQGPVNHVLPAWDVIAGSMMATSVVLAELHRMKTGEGQIVRLNLADIALAVASHLGLVAEAQLNDDPRPRIGNDVFGTFGRDFRTRDGHYVMVVALTVDQWRNLVEATAIADDVTRVENEHRVDLRDEGARFELRHEIAEMVQRWVGGRSMAEVADTFKSRGVLWGPYQTFKQLVQADPRCSAANPLFGSVEQPGIGKYVQAGSPIFFSAAAHQSPRPAPVLGADTKHVLSTWLEMGEATLGGLLSSQVISTHV